MATPGQIQKLYDVKIQGSERAYSEFDKINKLLLDIKKNAAGLEKQLAEIFNTEQARELRQRLDDIKVKEKELQLQLKESAALKKEMAAQELAAEKQAAVQRESVAKQQATLDESNARQAISNAKARAEADIAAAKMSVEAEKLAAQQIRTELEKIKLARANARGGPGTNTNAAPGSYNDIAQQYRDLLQVQKNTAVLADPAQMQAAAEQLMILKSQLDNFNRSLTQDKLLIGEYTSGIAKAFHQLGLGSLVTENVNTAKASLATLNSEFTVLIEELNQIKTTGVGNLQAVERQLIENRQAALQLTGQLGAVEAELKSMGGMGSQITSALSKEFEGLKGQLMSFITGYIGFQAVMMGIHEGVQINKDLSDSFADLEIRTHGSASSVASLAEELKKLDTRTSLTGLVDDASILAKKGIDDKEIEKTTQAIDNLMVALGKEIGDPHEAISSLVKLATVYSEDHHVTADNINAIGGAIAKLTTTGVATGPFLIDFAERMGGVRGITGLTIDKVLGLGAALEGVGQKVEVSASAMSQLVVKMFTEAGRYAHITGMELEDFQQLLHKDVLGAFLMVAEKLKGNAGEMEHFFEGVEEMKTKGVRMISVLGDMASNAEFARQRMAAATEGYRDLGLTAEMAAKKNETFAAVLDKIKKQFEVGFANPTFMAVMKGTAEAILMLISHLPLLITLFGLWAVGWAALNTQIVIARARLIGYNVAIGAYRIALGVVTTLQYGYAAALAVMTGAENAATAATEALSMAMEVSPIGVFGVALGAVAAIVVGFTLALSGNSAALNDHSRQMKLNIDINAKANAATAEQIANVNNLTSVIQDHTISLESRNHALKDLIALGGDYLKGLTLENATTKEGITLIDKYVDSLKKAAAYKAAQSVQSELLQKEVKLEAQQYSVEGKKASGRKDLITDEEGEGFGNSFLGFDVDGILNHIKEQREEIKKELAVTEKIIKEKYLSMDHSVSIGPEGANTENVNTPGGGGNEETVEDAYSRLAGEIEDIEEKINKAIYGSKEELKLREKLVNLKQEQDRISLSISRNRRAGSLFGHGSRLSAEENERTKLIDTDRDDELVALKTAYLEKEEEQKKFHGITIDNERVYLQQMQQLEEEAMQKKIDMIKGNKPAEQVARARLHLEILNSQQNYNQKYYQLDLDETKARKEKAGNVSKDNLDRVQNSTEYNDVDKANAKYGYYSELQDQFIKYMQIMDGLEKQYNISTKKNAEDRARMLLEIENNLGKSLIEVQEAAADKTRNAVEKTLAGIDKFAELKKQDLKKDANVARYRVNNNPKLSDKKKEEYNSKIDSTEAIGTDHVDIAANFDKDKAITDQLDELDKVKDKNAAQIKLYTELKDKKAELDAQAMDQQAKLDADNTKRRETAEAKAKAQQQKAELGALQVATSFANDYMSLLEKQDAYREHMAQRQMDWNKKLLDSQTQSKRQALQNERAYQLEEDKLAKDKAIKTKQRAEAQATIDFASAALKIFATADSFAEALPEEAVLTATYAAKMAMMASAPVYGDGTENHPGGVAIVGDKYESELASYGNNYFITPAVPTAVNLPAGAKITPPSKLPGLSSFSSAVLSRADYAGSLGSQLRAPMMIPQFNGYSSSSSASDTSKLHEMIMSNNKAISDLAAGVQRIQVSVSARDMSSVQGSMNKKVSVGAV